MSNAKNQVIDNIPPCPKPEEDDPCLTAMLMASYHVFPVVLNAAVDLDLFGIIDRVGGGAFMSPSEIVPHLPTHTPESADVLDRVLRLLVSHSLLRCSTCPGGDGNPERRYALSPAGKYYLRDEDSGSVSALSLFAYHSAIVQVLLRMKDAIVGGGNLFQKVHGMSIFGYMKGDPSLSKYFNDAMAELSAIQTKKVLEVYKGFEGLSVLVDVGGGNGATLRMILSQYPSLRGINFDLPQVIQHAPPCPGIEHVGGDMFTVVPHGDAIIIKGTCHNWSDENCIRFLINCYKALPPKGKVVVVDFIMPEEPMETDSSKYVAMLDNAMFIQPGGKERTEKQFEAQTCCGAGWKESAVSEDREPSFPFLRKNLDAGVKPYSLSVLPSSKVRNLHVNSESCKKTQHPIQPGHCIWIMSINLGRR